MWQKSLRSSDPPAGVEAKVVYVVVMGLTGAGKSTFISVATDRDDIPIDEDGDLDPVTQDVQDYVLQMRQDGVYYEVHLIDTRGFNDGPECDAEVLSGVGKYINMTYKLEQTLAGVLYLHDITKARWAESGNETFACWRR